MHSIDCHRSRGQAGEVHISNDLSRLLNLTDKLAQKRDDKFISSELFLLAVLEDKGQVTTILKECGANLKAVEKNNQ